MAPLWAVADRLYQNNSNIIAILGFQSSDMVFGEEKFRKYHAEIVVTTDDGSYGLKGYVSEHLDKVLSRKLDRAYACGPTPMLKAVAPILEKTNMACEISLEARMGCGFGVCLSCVVTVRNGETIENQQVCTEGPVFNLKDIVEEYEC